MEENQENKQPNTSLEAEDAFVPRPVWQVWGARIGLVVFIGFVILQILGIARGGW